MAAVPTSDTRADQNTTARRPGSTKKPVSASRAESNRRNAQKSTGPQHRRRQGAQPAQCPHTRHDRRVRPAAQRGCRRLRGPARRRQHGMAARNDLEAMVIDRIAREDWLSLRADRGAADWIATRLRNEAVQKAHVEAKQVAALGQRLLKDLKSTSHQTRARPTAPAVPVTRPNW